MQQLNLVGLTSCPEKSLYFGSKQYLGQRSHLADSVQLSPSAVTFGRLKPSFDIPNSLVDSQYHHYSPPAVTDTNPYGFSEEILGA